MTSKERVAAVLNGRLPDRVRYAEFAVDFDTVGEAPRPRDLSPRQGEVPDAFWEGRRDVQQSWLEDHIDLHRRLPLDVVTFPMATWDMPPRPMSRPPGASTAAWENRDDRIFQLSDATRDITCVRDPSATPGCSPRTSSRRRPTRFDATHGAWRILDAVVQRLKPEKYICGPSKVGRHRPPRRPRARPARDRGPSRRRAATRCLVRRGTTPTRSSSIPDSDAVLWADDLGYKTGPLSVRPLPGNLPRSQQEHGPGASRPVRKKILQHCCGKTSTSSWPTSSTSATTPTNRSSPRPTWTSAASRRATATGSPVESPSNLRRRHAGRLRADVRRSMACAKPGGRFILGSSHSVSVSTRYDNFLALLDEHSKLCQYYLKERQMAEPVSLLMVGVGGMGAAYLEALLKRRDENLLPIAQSIPNPTAARRVSRCGPWACRASSVSRISTGTRRPSLQGILSIPISCICRRPRSPRPRAVTSCARSPRPARSRRSGRRSKRRRRPAAGSPSAINGPSARPYRP